jgi:hypothetical protein
MGSDTYLRKAIEWHKRANDEDDPFVKFALEYIAFEALLQWLYRHIDHYGTNENKTRRLIQRVKQDSEVEELFMKKNSNIDLTNRINELKKNPLRNISYSEDRWWNCKEDYVDRCNQEVPQNNGKLRNEKDFVNMVEFIYRARNNMFHGHKNPTMERDEFIVETANIFIEPLINAILEIYVKT